MNLLAEITRSPFTAALVTLVLVAGFFFERSRLFVAFVMPGALAGAIIGALSATPGDEVGFASFLLNCGAVIMAVVVAVQLQLGIGIATFFDSGGEDAV